MPTSSAAGYSNTSANPLLNQGKANSRFTSKNGKNNKTDAFTTDSKKRSENVKTSGKGAIDNPLSNKAKARTTGRDLDKDAFLKLLLTQLQNQNPLEPMENTDFIAQMAQFSSLEQMQNLNSTMANSQAFNLVGKEVLAEVKNETTGKNETVKGLVSKVNVKSGVPYLVVGGKEVAFSQVQQVVGDGGISNIESSLVTSQTMALIGKNIQAIITSEDGKTSSYVEGKVDFVKFVNGTPVLSVNGKEIFPYEVLSVSEQGLLLGKEVTATIDGKQVTGKIEGITIKDKNIYATVNGKEVQITDLNSMITAISLVGKEVNSQKVTGTVSGVTIKDKIPYIVVNGKEYKIGDIY